MAGDFIQMNGQARCTHTMRLRRPKIRVFDGFTSNKITGVQSKSNIIQKVGFFSFHIKIFPINLIHLSA